MSRLNDLIRQVGLTNETLAADLQREVAALADRRSFGLNFERHVPEAVELPGRQVRRGDKVRVLPPRGEMPKQANEKLWRVKRIDRSGETPVAELETLVDDGENATAVVDELVVVAEFRDPIYPGLVSTGKVERGGDKPFHTVINAENYHALQALLFTHRGKVDCIYIDPPYNTGNEGWIYNDAYVAADDHYKHSKWLAFMERRLLLARELLADAGVIIVAIGEDEHHRLRMLMDQVFDSENFIMNVTWQGGGSAVARHHAGGVDYMLIYGRDAERVPKFLDPKPYVPEMLELVRNAFARGATAEDAQRELRAFIKSHKDMPEGVTRFNNVDESGMIFETADLTNQLDRPNLRYPVTDPDTGRVYEPPKTGWTVRRELMDELIAARMVVFGKSPRRKKSLSEYSHSMPLPSFSRSRITASSHLARVLGDKRFPFPKDHEVVMRWLRMSAPKDGLILDFFGGSGTTCEAVMRLNSEDGGTRRSILITNNEVSSKEAKQLRKAGLRPGDPDWERMGVCEHVAQPRLLTVARGTRPDGSQFSEGLNENLEFFRLTYEAPLRVASHREFERIAPLLWLRAGSRGRRIEDVAKGWDVAEAYGVLTDLDQVEPFVQAVAEQDSVELAFIVTDEDRLFESIVRELPDHVEPVRLYEAYLRNFEIESGRGLR